MRRVRGSTRFTRRLRLVKARDFERVFQKPSKSTDEMVIVLARCNGLTHPRLGLAISRKYVAQAVTRTRIKRLIRESFRTHQDLIRGLDLVVMVRKKWEVVDSAGLFQSLHRHWKCLSRRCEGC